MNANEREKELYSMDIQEFADWVEEYHGDMLSEVTAGRLRQQQAEIEALKKKINGDAFCDANCVWTDHHPDCHIGKE